ncbi:DUF6114 domain-containing protein [Kitasatospora sp. NPDC096147]|uniref:DUF6114 domain-containing protein n=1 Tax=Kitasatospora sp. NPDC096147 TaxID=3364093 RepID=UPI0037FB5C0D
MASTPTTPDSPAAADTPAAADGAATADGGAALDSPAPPPAAMLTRARLGFRRWRRSRPFWASAWTGLGGFVILYLPLAPVGRILHVGVGGITGMAGGAILMALAGLMLLLPGQRHTAGVVAVIVGVASFPLTNLGGFFVGMFLAVLGGSMAVGWLPEKPARRAGLFRRRGGRVALAAAGPETAEV